MGVAQIFPDFYVDTPDTGLPQVGEFFWVPTPDVNFKIAEASRPSPEATRSVEIRLVSYDASLHFKAKDRLPTLLVRDETAEALVYQGKKRPCLVLANASVRDLDSIADPVQRRMAKQLGLQTYLVAPCYSCASAAAPRQFTPVITARVRALQYPHLAYMTPPDGQGPGSILRLDRVFATTLGVGMHRVGRRLHPEVKALVMAQLCEVLQIEMPATWEEHLRTTKELVKDCLPDGLA